MRQGSGWILGTALLAALGCGDGGTGPAGDGDGQRPASQFQIMKGRPVLPSGNRAQVKFQTDVMKFGAVDIDVDVTGAQVLSCSALKPTKTVKMLLPSTESPVLCRGRIVWARLEPTTPGKPIRYRAGMFFTATDQAAVQTFIARHGASGRG